MLEPISTKNSSQKQLKIPIYKNPTQPLNWLELLKIDWQIIFERDPAARNSLEVLFCYPGLQALIVYRIAHQLWLQGIPLFPRLISHLGRFLTGIEIHPGANIGKGVFIDHGMGVAIGETAIVGDYCSIYQDVTLGGTGDRDCKRHPTLGNHVIVGAGAKILGNIYIADRVRIGASSVVLTDVPADFTVVGIPGRIVRRPNNSPAVAKENLKDNSLRQLLKRIEILEEQISHLSR